MKAALTVVILLHLCAVAFSQNPPSSAEAQAILAKMRAQQSGLSIVGRSYRLLASCSIMEEFINLTHSGRISRLWRHIPSRYAWLWVAEPSK